MQANVNPENPADPLNGLAAAINVLAGTTPIFFSGDYRLSVDVWLSVSTPDNYPLAPATPAVPFPTNGSTEQLLWGVGTDDVGPLEARISRGLGAHGTWGWLAGENGYGTEDAAINENDTELADLGDTQLGEDHFFNNAFQMPVTSGAPNDAPANSWVRVDIEVLGGNVRVLYNDVEFFSRPSSATSGFALIGYEDPFNSVAAYTPAAGMPDFPVEDYIWGLFDNFTVTQIPEPTAIMAAMTGVILVVVGRRVHR
jgi:hypothetical protein